MNAFFSTILISTASLPGVWLVADTSETASEAVAVHGISAASAELDAALAIHRLKYILAMVK